LVILSYSAILTKIARDLAVIFIGFEAFPDYNLGSMNLPFSLKKNVSLKALNTFGIDAYAQTFVKLTSLEQVEGFYAYLQAHPEMAQLPRLILGGGSNLILSDQAAGIVIQIGLLGKTIVDTSPEQVIVQAQAGENWHEFVLWTLAQGLGGLENLSLIPGTVGASPIQNIGAYGIELQDYFLDLTAFDLKSGQVIRMSKAECQFAYRDSIFKRSEYQDLIILEVRFALPVEWQPRLDYGDIKKALAEMGVTSPGPADVSRAVIQIRQSKLPDPRLIGNAGSFFKNPMVTAEVQQRILSQFPECVSYRQANGDYKLAAGWLIEQCGWKGRQHGNVGVYQKQALVLVNLGGATGENVRDIAQMICADVMLKFGVALEVEPVFF
jgi:UDP-N-acetylmuramate dehydrogenase